MRVIPVSTPAQKRRFLDLPYRLYRNDPIWVAPLRRDVAAEFDPHRNPFLAHCDHQLFLLERNGEAVGRVAAFVDYNAIAQWGAPIGHFGYFECPHDPEAARLLLDAARDWLRSRDMTRMRGPWTFVSQEWGLVIEGFEPSPCVMGPYNPPFYRHLLEGAGLAKAKDLLVFEIDAAKGYRVPNRILDLTDRVRNRIGVTVRRLDMANYDADVTHVFDLVNKSITGNWGYVPQTEAEVRAVARDLRPVVDPRGVVFAEYPEGAPIGFAIAIPDVNVALKGLNGRLFPFGWSRLLWRMRRLNAWRMFALGVVPAFQGRGVDALLYRALHDSLYAPDTRLEINYILEDNKPMLNAVSRLGATPLRRYRVYEQAL